MRLAALLAVVGLLALPSAASADTWVGKSNQRYRSVLITNPDGSIKSVKIKWRARCRRASFGPVTGVWENNAANPIERSGSVFSDSGPIQDADGPYEVVGTISLKGRFLANGKAVYRQIAQFEVRRGDRVVDTCKSNVRIVARKR